MTRDDILRMVMESCDPNTEPAWHNGFWTLTQEELERFAALVAAAEREACAYIILDAARKAADFNNLRDYELLSALAAAIRARG